MTINGKSIVSDHSELYFMNDRVTVTKRSIYDILSWVALYLWLPECIFLELKFDMNIFKWILLAFVLCTIPCIYFVLVYVNEKITVSSEGIIHILPAKRKIIYRWGDVKKVYLGSCGRYSHSMLIFLLSDRKKLKIPFYLKGYDLLKEYMVDYGILGMYSDSPLYYYTNMENHSKYIFDKSSKVQSFGENKIDISDVIDKVISGQYLLASDILNQKTDIGMGEAFLYVRQMKYKNERKNKKQ